MTSNILPSGRHAFHDGYGCQFQFLLCEEIRSWEHLFQIQERLIYFLKYPYGNSTFKIQQGDIKEHTSRNTFLENHFKAQGRTSTLEAERFIMVPGAERERKST